MKAALVFALGALGGALLVSAMEPASKHDCCKRVAVGARSEVLGLVKGGGCGKPASRWRVELAGLVGELGDRTNLWDRFPGLLEKAGVSA